MVASAIIFGVRALLVTVVSIIASVAFEWLYCKLLKKPNLISDLSAVVTGLSLIHISTFWGFAQASPSTVMVRSTTGMPVARYLPRVDTCLLYTSRCV